MSTKRKKSPNFYGCSCTKCGVWIDPHKGYWSAVWVYCTTCYVARFDNTQPKPKKNKVVIPKDDLHLERCRCGRIYKVEENYEDIMLCSYCYQV